MKVKLILSSIFSLLIFQSQAQVPGAKVGSFDQFIDVGSPLLKGSASYQEPTQTYHLTGSGRNIWFDQDSFAFLNKKMNGDFILQTQVKFLGEGHEQHRKEGLMIRSSSATNS